MAPANGEVKVGANHPRVRAVAEKHAEYTKANQ
jgi:hypothetical protein